MESQDGFFGLPPQLLTALGVLAGYALLGDLTADQMTVLGNFLILIGQVLDTVSAQKAQQQGQTQEGELRALWAALEELRQRLEE